jgi:hypothetical protein
MCLWTDLRRAQDHGVATSQGRGDRADAKNDRSVPWRHAENNACRLADRERQNAGLVRRYHLASNLGRQRCRLAQHAGGQMNVESGPRARGANFFEHRFCKFRDPRLEQIGGFQQERAPFSRSGLRPGRECPGRRDDDRFHVGQARGRRLAHDLACDRILARERRARGRADRRAVNDKFDFHG